MKSVALVTYDTLPQLSASDRMLLTPLQQEGFTVQAVPWNKKEVAWKNFDAVILRSCWDYHRNLDEFFQWLTLLEQQKVSVWNPLAIVRWNAEKTYLQNFASRIPTVWVNYLTENTLEQIMAEQGWETAVVKPTIGASAHEVFLVQKAAANKVQQRLDRLRKKTGVMIQPFIPEIQSEGELSIVFIDGTYSHTVQKIPARNEFLITNRSTQICVTPDPKILDQAQKIYTHIDSPLLYARIDGISIQGKFFLMEVELIEPQLFFNLYPQGATTFAGAVKKLVESNSYKT